MRRWLAAAGTALTLPLRAVPDPVRPAAEAVSAAVDAQATTRVGQLQRGLEPGSEAITNPYMNGNA